MCQSSSFRTFNSPVRQVVTKTRRWSMIEPKARSLSSIISSIKTFANDSSPFLSPPEMFHFFIYKLALILLGFNAVILTRYLIHAASTRRGLHLVPGPATSSFVWGEEWELYCRAPGSLYSDWHERFGKLVTFTGAFGVSPEGYMYL